MKDFNVCHFSSIVDRILVGTLNQCILINSQNPCIGEGDQGSLNYFTGVSND